MFYGYFAQVERVKRLVKEKEEQARQQQETAEEIGRQRERLEVLHEINVAVASTIDSTRILNAFLEKAIIHLPYAAAMVRLRHRETGLLETAASKENYDDKFATSINPLGLADEIFEARSLVTVGSVFEDARIKDCELFQREGLRSLQDYRGCQWRHSGSLILQRRTSFR